MSDQNETRQQDAARISRRQVLKYGAAGAVGAALFPRKPLGAIAPRVGRRSTSASLVVWDRFTDPQGGAAATKIYSMFEAAHPSVTINRQAYPYTYLLQKTQLALASGAGPDIVYYGAGNGFGGQLASAGVIRPLDDFAKEYDWLKRFPSVYRSTSTFKGHLYGLPLETTIDCQLVNKTLIAKNHLEIPETWDDLVAFCKAARKKGHIALSYSQNPGVFAKNELNQYILNLMGPQRLQAHLENGSLDFNSPNLVEAFKAYFVELPKVHAFPAGVNGLTYDQANALFNSGTCLIQPGGSWGFRHIQAATAHWNVQFIPFYKLPRSQGRFFPTAADPCWYMSEATHQPSLAAEFLDFLYSPKAVKVWAEVANFTPPVAFDASSYKIGHLQKSTIAVLQGALQKGNSAANVVGPSISEYISSSMFNNLADFAQGLVSGSVSPASAAAQLESGWQQFQQQLKA